MVEESVMDPDETLRRIRMITENIDQMADGEAEHVLAELVDLVTSLDQWLKKGSYLPMAWRRASAP